VKLNEEQNAAPNLPRDREAPADLRLRVVINFFGLEHMPGHRFFFSPDEIQVIDKDARK
jgi:hypothetical protein